MRLPQFDYFCLHTIEEACSFMYDHQQEAVILAGGTALIISLGQRLLQPRYILGLKGITGLNDISHDNRRGLAIGALTTIEALTGSSVIRQEYAVLAEAAGAIAAPPLQHMATIGGNLCQDTRCIYYNQSYFWRQVREPCFKRGGGVCHAVKGGKHCFSVYQSDLAPVLLALEAKVKLVRKHGGRVIPINEFFTGKGEKPNVLEPDEIIAEIQLPPPSENSAGSYQKLRVREAIDFPLAGVAAVFNIDGDKVCRKAKLVLGAVASAPVELREAEKILEGRKVDHDVIEEAAEAAFEAAHPVANLSIDASYRRKMTGVLLKRAAMQALGQYGEQ